MSRLSRRRYSAIFATCMLPTSVCQSAAGEGQLHAESLGAEMSLGVGVLYDCEGEQERADSWVPTKRAWCCLYKSAGCSGYYQCHAGLQDSAKLWSHTKQEWCCRNEQLGCMAGSAGSTAIAAARRMPVKGPLSDGPEEPFNCMDGLWDWERWSADKQQWCCTHKLRWCPEKIADAHATDAHAVAAHAIAFDCHAGAAGLWPEDQRTWCCRHKQLGCPKACSTSCSTSGRSATCSERVSWIRKNKFDGDSEVDACQSAYKVMARECDVCSACQLADVCPDSGPSEDFDCHSGSIGTWSIAKKQECCKTQGIGCSSLFPPYDCQFQVPDEWTSSKQVWCCVHEGRGCTPTEGPATSSATSVVTTTTLETTSTEATTSSLAPTSSWATVRFITSGNSSGAVSYDCASLERHVEEQWPEEQLAWCCKRHQKRCSSLPQAVEGNWSSEEMMGEELVYECGLDEDANRANWSSKQAAWCCEHFEVGCRATVTTTTSEPFDCVRGYLRWRSIWSPRQAEWCCLHFGRGCIESTSTVTASHAGRSSSSSTTTATERFDCTQDLDVWRTSWSYSKASWCCITHQKGCLDDADDVVTSASANFDCGDGLSSYWPDWKAKWCCDHHSRGCSVATAKQPYSCETDMQAVWSDSQRVWCCLHYSQGCGGAAQSQELDCLAGLAQWKEVWPAAKQEWCCTNQGLGCSPTTTTQPYDCRSGLDHWSTAWSDGKQAWCCLYEQIGCPREARGDQENVAGQGLDDRGDRTHDDGDSDTVGGYFPYDCEYGLDDVVVWALAKIEWCCFYGTSLVRDRLREDFACPSAPGASGGEHLTKQTFQRKFRQQLPGQLLHLEEWLVPTVFGVLVVIAASGTIRTCSRGAWSRAGSDLFYGGSSRIFRPLDVEADEVELLLELPGRMEREEWPQRC